MYTSSQIISSNRFIKTSAMFKILHVLNFIFFFGGVEEKSEILKLIKRYETPNWKSSIVKKLPNRPPLLVHI